jgi:chaperone BCS1
MQLPPVPSQLGGILPTSANPIFMGGLGLMGLSAAFASLKAWPKRLWTMATSRLYIECTVPHDDEAFTWFAKWLMLRAAPAQASRFYFMSRWENDEVGGNKRTTNLVLGQGERVFTYDGAKLWISIQEEREGLKRALSMAIRCRTKHRHVLEKIALEIDQLQLRPHVGMTRIMAPGYDCWRALGLRPMRPEASVVLSGALFDELLGDIQRFRSRSDWYRERGIPYRRGFGLFGPPGNGKSSLAAALAGAMDMDLYCLSLGDIGMDDSKLQLLMSRVPSQALVVIEDIDTVFEGRERRGDSKLTLSGLLNTIDGPLATEGRILIMTSNHPDRLDPALVRPGRIDRAITLANAQPDQARRLLARIFPDAAESQCDAFAAWAGDGSQSMATLQGHLIMHQDHIDRAIQQPAGQVF